MKKTKWTWQVEDRQAIPWWLPGLVLLASILAGLTAAGLIFVFKGISPLYALGKIFSSSFGSAYGWKSTISKALPLLLIAGGLTVVFQGKFWNIGAEGQLLMGAIAATWIGLKGGQALPAIIILPLMILGAFAAGALWAMIPGFLRVRYTINEVVSTLMLNYIAAFTLQTLVTGPWKGESQYGFPYTDDLPEAAQLYLIPGTRIHLLTLILGLLAAGVLFFLVYRTRFGYEVRVIGENHEAARYAGIDFMKTTLVMMLVSGGLAGLAGLGEVAGIHHHLSTPAGAISSGYGFTAIIVAWLAKLNPLLTIFSSLFFAGILVGGDAIQISLGLPAATVDIFNGLILFFIITGDFFVRNRIVLKKREG